MNQASTTQSQEHAVFLSFTSLDREAARAVVAGLRAAGVDVWWDEGGIGWGDDWQSKLEEALSRCGAYLILLGRGGVRRWVKPELGVALRRHVDDGLPILPLLSEGVAPESLPPFLSLFQARSLPSDLDGFDFADLAAELRGASLPRTPQVSDACPFPGLLPFDEDSAEFFLGRQSDTLALLERFGRGVDGVQRRWLQVEGPSGVGKSSLVRAGLVPAVHGGWMEEGAIPAKWLVTVVRPGEQPLEALASALERAIGTESVPATVFQRLEALRRTGGEDADLRYMLKVAFPEGRRLLLIIDQFEELFTLTSEPAVLARIDTLLATALEDADGPLYLVTTMRSDFLLRIGDLPRLQGLLNARAGRYDLQPVNLAGLREIVRIPAQRAGLTWSEPSLPERIVEDAIRERAPLPLVANLLRLLWESADKRGSRVLQVEDYGALNGVAGALAKGADRLLAGLGDEGRERARRLLLALVKPGKESQDTKRPISRGEALEAAGGGPKAERILRRLSGLRDAKEQAVDDANPRLVVVSEGETDKMGENAYRVDLAHEALLRLNAAGDPYWRTLRKWVDDWRKQLEDRDLLERLAEQWAEQGSPRLSGLATGRQLKDFGQVTGARDPAPGYLRASRLRRRLMSSLWLIGVVALVAGVNAYWLATEDITLGHEFAIARVHLQVWTGHVNEPEMVTIKGGSFQMGCISGKTCQDDEKPLHEVQVRRFAMGRTEVTFDQYDLFALATGRTIVDDSDWRRGERPVINVNWNDADAYAQWLRGVTGKPYRLPSEAEWEYAARAGTETPFWTGDCIDTEQANYNGKEDYPDCGATGVYRGKTVPSGSLPANEWGLHEVAGNVWEWVQDCWHENYAGAPPDQSAWLEADNGDCGRRVIRGGSWYGGPWDLRSANRSRDKTVGTFYLLGFRLAQDID